MIKIAFWNVQRKQNLDAQSMEKKFVAWTIALHVAELFELGYQAVFLSEVTVNHTTFFLELQAHLASKGIGINGHQVLVEGLKAAVSQCSFLVVYKHSDTRPLGQGTPPLTISKLEPYGVIEHIRRPAIVAEITQPRKVFVIGVHLIASQKDSLDELFTICQDAAARWGKRILLAGDLNYHYWDLVLSKNSGNLVNQYVANLVDSNLPDFRDIPPVPLHETQRSSGILDYGWTNLKTQVQCCFPIPNYQYDSSDHWPIGFDIL
jgi:hypothetical protein